MPKIWTYSDPADRGYRLFKSRLLAALRERGWETELTDVELGSEGFERKIADAAENSRADAVLLINQSAATFYQYIQHNPSPEFADARKITWFLDDPQFLVDQPFEPREYVFVFDDTYLPAAKAWGGAAVAHLPLASDMTEAGTHVEKWACPVSFVGGLQDQSSRRAQLSPEMAAYCDRLVELHLADRRRPFQQLVVEEPYAPGKQIQLTGQVCHFLYWEANIRYRLRMLEPLVDLGLVVYGNEDWVPLAKDTKFESCFRGGIDPVTELPHLFASCDVNINLHSVQCRGSLNQRDYNAPVAGGFLVSDWVPGAGRFFEPGREAVFVHSAEELRTTVEYYLDHLELRGRFAERARERVAQEHTYAHRVESILGVLGDS